MDFLSLISQHERNRNGCQELGKYAAAERNISSLGPDDSVIMFMCLATLDYLERLNTKVRCESTLEHESIYHIF